MGGPVRGWTKAHPHAPSGREESRNLPARLPRPRSPLFRPGLGTLLSPPPPGYWLFPLPQAGDP